MVIPWELDYKKLLWILICKSFGSKIFIQTKKIKYSDSGLNIRFSNICNISGKIRWWRPFSNSCRTSEKQSMSIMDFFSCSFVSAALFLFPGGFPKISLLEAVLLKLCNQRYSQEFCAQTVKALSKEQIPLI